MPALIDNNFKTTEILSSECWNEIYMKKKMKNKKEREGCISYLKLNWDASYFFLFLNGNFCVIIGVLVVCGNPPLPNDPYYFFSLLNAG